MENKIKQNSNLTNIKYVTYAAAINIREEIKGTGSYKLETRSQKTPQEVR